MQLKYLIENVILQIIDPVYCEITIRRLENYRKNGKTGWQNSNPFMNEIIKDKKMRNYLEEKI